MGIEAKLKALLQEIDEEIDPESISGDSRLMADIGMSSVALLYMAVAVEETATSVPSMVYKAALVPVPPLSRPR